MRMVPQTIEAKTSSALVVSYKQDGAWNIIYAQIYSMYSQSVTSHVYRQIESSSSSSSSLVLM